MAKMYWAWTRDTGPGLCSVELPMAVCQRELELGAAQPVYPKEGLLSDAIGSEGVVLEVCSLESEGRLAAGYYRLAERRSDPVIQKLMHRF